MAERRGLSWFLSYIGVVHIGMRRGLSCFVSYIGVLIGSHGSRGEEGFLGSCRTLELFTLVLHQTGMAERCGISWFVSYIGVVQIWY